MIRALILDLDNTIYPVSAIAAELFPPFIQLIAQYEGCFTADELQGIRYDMTQKPFQHVAEKYGFNPELTSRVLIC